MFRELLLSFTLHMFTRIKFDVVLTRDDCGRLIPTHNRVATATSPPSQSNIMAQKVLLRGGNGG